MTCIREIILFEIAPSYTNMVPMIIPFFSSIPCDFEEICVSHFRVFLVFPLLIQSDILFSLNSDYGNRKKPVGRDWGCIVGFCFLQKV
jgi:hypothetical protein